MIFEEYFHDYMQDIYAKSEAENNYKEVLFTERVCEFLVDQAVLEEYTLVSYKKTNSGMRVDAYQHAQESGAFTFIITDYRLAPETLTQSDMTKIFKRVSNFFEKSLERKFHQALDESDVGFSIAREIYDYSKNIKKINFILISTAELSSRAKTLANESISNYPCFFDVWDLGRIQRLEESGKPREDIVVDFTSIDSNGLPCLPAFIGNDTYQSYLLAIPGSLIANLYDQYGERLLEQNVRTFLQFRGKVNKGIRNTIQNEPEMFFAFNNGITATAEEVITGIDEKQVKIKSIKNLQIVNGGQTTASLFNSQNKNTAHLASVYVQVKLTVIPPERTEEIVPRISEYANTQNKVSAADFFSNHPFHLRVEEMSRRLWAPSSEGSLKETHWYYERVRGQYANAQSNFTASKKKEFLTQNPRNQMFTKTDLAKFEYSWDKKPHIVSLGAQKNFVQFASDIAKSWEKNEKQFNELYFKEFIVKAILFRFLDKTIMKQSWYGGYKANIVTYSIAKFSYLIDNTGKSFDFDSSWKAQSLSAPIQSCLHEIAALVNDSIQDTPDGITNVTEWCKKPKCWENVVSINYSLDESFLIDGSVHQQQESDAIKTQKIDNGIEAQSYVFEKGASYWMSILEWDKENEILTPKEQGVILIAASIPKKIPSEKQALIAIKIESKVAEDGFLKST